MGGIMGGIIGAGIGWTPTGNGAGPNPGGWGNPGAKTECREGGVRVGVVDRERERERERERGGAPTIMPGGIGPTGGIGGPNIPGPTGCVGG